MNVSFKNGQEPSSIEDLARDFTRRYIETNSVPPILQGGLEDEILAAAEAIFDGFTSCTLQDGEALDEILAVYADAWYGDRMDEYMTDAAAVIYPFMNIEVHDGGIVNFNNA